mgnify:CR=1 FL=1
MICGMCDFELILKTSISKNKLEISEIFQLISDTQILTRGNYI